jgi:citrate lyase subunit beta/citryl-CoA lyase
MTAITPARPPRPRRSVLYVSAANERALDKARSLAADAIVFDLEDSVAPAQKDAARERLRTFFAAGPLAHGREAVIRINGLSTPWGGEDLLTARACKPDAILIPKVDEPDDITSVADVLGETDAPDRLRLWAMIETPRGVMNAGLIARASRGPASRLDCFVTGTNDLVKETGVVPQPGRPYISTWLMQIVLAARAYRLDVIDGVYNDFRDDAGFRAECREGRAMGFDGKSVIHPAQIDAANAIFGIDPDKLAEARAIVAAFALPEHADAGVISLDGRMVERLHAEMAASLIEKARRLDAMTFPPRD